MYLVAHLNRSPRWSLPIKGANAFANFAPLGLSRYFQIRCLAAHASGSSPAIVANKNTSCTAAVSWPFRYLPIAAGCNPIARASAASLPHLSAARFIS